MIIYKATNKITKKFYIGKSVYSLSRRIRTHNTSAMHNSNTHFHNAIRKYGLNSFKWEILYSSNKCSKQQLAKKEKQFVKLFDAYNRNKSYNMTRGGDGGDTLSNHPNKSVIIKKLSRASEGRKKTSEEIQKISNNQPMKGKHRSKRNKKMISIQTKKAMWRPEIREKYLKAIAKREKRKHDNKIAA